MSFRHLKGIVFAISLAFITQLDFCSASAITIRGAPIQIDTMERLESDDIIRKNLFQFYHEFKRKRNQRIGGQTKDSANPKLAMNQAQINDNAFKNCDFTATNIVNIIFCDDGKFIVQSAADHSWMSFHQLPQELRQDVVNGMGNRAFKFFKRANNIDQAIMMVGLKFYIVEFNIQTLEMHTKKEIDMAYLSDQYPSTDFARIRDIQILDDRKSYGFISWKSAIKINNQAWLEFFIFDDAHHKMQSYDSRSMNVAPDIIRESDNQILFVNHHFEFKKDSDHVWFNYLDNDFNFINLELKLPRNKFGQFDKAVLGESQIVNINDERINSKPNRFARFGNVAVLSFKDENKLLIQDLVSSQKEIVEPTVYEKQVGQQLLRIDPIHSAQVPDSHDRVKVMYHLVDSNLAQQPQRTFINEVHMYFDYHYSTWKYYYFDKVIQLDDQSQKQTPQASNPSAPQVNVFSKKIKKLNQKEQYDKIFGILRETSTDKQRLLLRSQNVHATFLKVCMKQDEYDREVQRNGYTDGQIRILECSDDKIQKDINRIQSILKWNTKQKYVENYDEENNFINAT